MSDVPVAKNNLPNLFHYGNMFEEHLPKDKRCGYLRRLLPFDRKRFTFEGYTFALFSLDGDLLDIGNNIKEIIKNPRNDNYKIYLVH